MKARKLIALMLCCEALPLLATTGSPTASSALAGCRPSWTIGDWWTVDSQRYDHGENRAGGTPAWLDKETWKFSVDATNTVDGEACYQVSVKPGDQNRCPYWFVYSFRMSDLLVMRQELHQPNSGKSGRVATAAVVESNYSKDEEMPFAPSDFPNLPVTVPQFAGAATNFYRASNFSFRNHPSATGTPRCSRSFTDSMTQAFHSGENMSPSLPAGAKSFAISSNSGAGSKSGLVTISPSADKFERQNWDNAHPWHLYAEKWEFGELVRKSWLSDYGHAPVGTQNGGAK